jgi:uncharacterized protein (DUF1697 family)
MTECVALIRGINVGRAKRIAMAELRDLVASLGHENVRTLMNSGNVIFTSRRPNKAKLAGAIKDAIAGSFGISASVIVITAAELNKIIEENPLLTVVKDPAKHLVAFAADSGCLEAARALMKQSWRPDALAVGSTAAYLWCAAGVLDSKLSQAFARATKDAVTARNWATVLKLRTAASTSA